MTDWKAKAAEYGIPLHTDYESDPEAGMYDLTPEQWTDLRTFFGALWEGKDSWDSSTA